MECESSCLVLIYNCLFVIMASPKALSRGKQHHVCIIYNHARSKFSKTPDSELALKFVQELDRRLANAGYNRNFYHDRDAIPGRNIFSELFRLVRCSEWVVVILTGGFIKNCWSQYRQMAAFHELMEECRGNPESGVKRLIPIMLGDEICPENLRYLDVLSFETDTFLSDEMEWTKLMIAVSLEYEIVTDTEPHQSTGQQPVSNSEGRQPYVAQATSERDETDRNPSLSNRVGITDRGVPVHHPSSISPDDLSVDQPSISSSTISILYDRSRSSESETDIKSLARTSSGGTNGANSPREVGAGEDRSLGSMDVTDLEEDMQMSMPQSAPVNATRQTQISRSAEDNNLSSRTCTIQGTTADVQVGQTLKFSHLDDESVKQHKTESIDSNQDTTQKVAHMFLAKIGGVVVRSIINQFTGYQKM